MKKRIAAVLLAAGMIASASITANAAQTDAVPLSAQIDAGIVAADYAQVGSDLHQDGSLPSAYSSLERGYLTPVRSQRYNTCWAYSSTAILEVLLSKLDMGVGHLSTMAMNYGSVTDDDGTGWMRSYSDAGYPYIALGWLTSNGAVTDADFSDQLQYDDYLAVKDTLKPYAYADAVIYLDGSDPDTVKTAVYQYGAAVGNFHYSSIHLNEQTNAYYCDVETIATSSLFGHAVAIIGWDDSFSAENFIEDHRPEYDGAWLCKNSWGESWGGMNGYFWISYEDMHLFDSRFGPSYAIVDVTLASERIRMKQNEIYGATYEFDYNTPQDGDIASMTYVNVLDFSDEFSVIDKVVFESVAEGSAYEVFYIPTDEPGVPITDESLWVKLGEGTVGYQGYICSDINDYKAPETKGAVGVRISRTGESGAVSIGVDEWLATSSRTIFTPQSRHGMSYLIGGDQQAVDVMDYYQEQMDDEIGGTFVIKAIAYTGRKYGDVDKDNSVTILDATHIQRYLADIRDFSDVERIAADYDRDGKITILDCTRIQRMLAGIIE